MYDQYDMEERMALADHYEERRSSEYDDRHACFSEWLADQSIQQSELTYIDEIRLWADFAMRSRRISEVDYGVSCRDFY